MERAFFTGLPIVESVDYAGWFAKFWSDVTWGVWLYTEQAKFYRGGFYSTADAFDLATGEGRRA